MNKRRRRGRRALLLLPLLFVLTTASLALAVNSISVSVTPSDATMNVAGGEGTYTISNPVSSPPAPNSASVTFGSSLPWWWSWYIYNNAQVDVTFPSAPANGQNYKVSVTVYNSNGEALTWGEGTITGDGSATTLTATFGLEIPITVFDLTASGNTVEVVVVPS
ncbi:MAG: hypothetical protein GSR85_08275 [Desulfurococcales archaeon]|nr:hypothetical protein [Desulfurococcales archaeon]